MAFAEARLIFCQVAVIVFTLGCFFFFFFALQMVPEKQEQCFILAAKAKEVCGLSLGSSNTTE